MTESKAIDLIELESQIITKKTQLNEAERNLAILEKKWLEEKKDLDSIKLAHQQELNKLIEMKDKSTQLSRTYYLRQCPNEAIHNNIQLFGKYPIREQHTIRWSVSKRYITCLVELRDCVQIEVLRTLMDIYNRNRRSKPDFFDGNSIKNINSYGTIELAYVTVKAKKEIDFKMNDPYSATCIVLGVDKTQELIKMVNQKYKNRSHCCLCGERARYRNWFEIPNIGTFVTCCPGSSDCKAGLVSDFKSFGFIINKCDVKECDDCDK